MAGGDEPSASTNADAGVETGVSTVVDDQAGEAAAQRRAELLADPFGSDLALGATGLLGELNTTGVELGQLVTVTAADVHVARASARLAGCTDEAVHAALALTVRAARLGSVCLDIGSLPAAPLPGWPEAEQWRGRLLASPLVRECDRAAESSRPAAESSRPAGESSRLAAESPRPAAESPRPLVLDGSLLYLDRYWSDEGHLAADITVRVTAQTDVGAALLDRTVAQYFPPEADGSQPYADQADAAKAAVRHTFTVVTGGPGTGKTTTIARLLGVLLECEPRSRIALAAPTGRAAARLGEAIADATLNATFPARHRGAIRALKASTLHRLLGFRHGEFSYSAANTLPYDAVVVDETSMVSLTMMSRLVAAMRPKARLILVGDADQLASVDAGAVLGDLVAGVAVIAPEQVRTLGRSHRFGADIAGLASAIQSGDAELTLDLLSGGGSAVSLVPPDTLAQDMLAHALELRQVAVDDSPEQALVALDRHRLLCAHREGKFGAAYWNRLIERSLAEALHRPSGLGPWYPGRPVIVTENDYGLGLFNGDVGITVLEPTSPGGMAVRIHNGTDSGAQHAVARLSQVRSAHAMTVHRSQGSQVDDVTVLLPDLGSPLLTRQLLYTAVTRAKKSVRVIGSPEAVVAAVGHQALRASGLAERLAPQ